MTTAAAQVEQAKVLSFLTFLPDPPGIFAEWQRLVVTYDVKGKNAHDARRGDGGPPCRPSADVQSRRLQPVRGNHAPRPGLIRAGGNAMTASGGNRWLVAAVSNRVV